MLLNTGNPIGFSRQEVANEEITIRDSRLSRHARYPGSGWRTTAMAALGESRRLTTLDSALVADYPDLPDKQLMARLAMGDIRAFEALYDVGIAAVMRGGSFV